MPWTASDVDCDVSVSTLTASGSRLSHGGLLDAGDIVVLHTYLLVRSELLITNVDRRWPSSTWIHALSVFTSLLYMFDCMGRDNVMLEGGHPVPGQWPSSTWIPALSVFTSLLYMFDCMGRNNVMLGLYGGRFACSFV